MSRIIKFGKIWINPEHITHMDTPDGFVQDDEHGYTVVMHMVSGELVATTMVGYPSQDAALAEAARAVRAGLEPGHTLRLGPLGDAAVADALKGADR